MHPAEPQEQVDVQRVLAIYRGKLAQATEEIVMLEARILNRDDELARLRAERDQPDVYK